MTDVPTNFFVGAACSAVVNLVSEPADRVRAGYRAQDYDPKVVSGKTPRANNLAQWVHQLGRREGLRVLLPDARRLVERSQMVRDGLRLAVKDGITTHSFRKRHARSEWKQFFAINCTAGGIAGYLAHVVLYPFRGAGGLSLEVLRTDPRSLYSGFWQSAGPAVAYCVIFFGMYDTLSGRNPYEVYTYRHVDTDKFVFGYKAVSGQVAGVCAALLSQPYVTASYRLVNRNPYDHTGMNRKYFNVHHAMARIMREEGMSSLFRGLVFYPSMLFGVAVVMYDVGKKAVHPLPEVLEDEAYTPVLLGVASS